jgi:hypothetical protein
MACVVTPFLNKLAKGTASCGIDPGSVNIVLAWDANARAHIVVKTMAMWGCIPLFCAKNDIVRMAYRKRTHTMELMTAPTVSP